MDPRRVLVTGAAGFVGSNLVRALGRAGAEVHALVRPTSETWRLTEGPGHPIVQRVDVTDVRELQSLFSRIRPDVIFHLAAARHRPQDREQRLEALKNTVLGTACLLEASSDLEYSRLVHVGSSLEYGAKEGPIEETDRIEPTSHRGVTKAASTLLARHFAVAEERPVTILRPFCIYGPWQSESAFIPTAVKAVMDGEDLALTRPGYKRDWVYVDDVVSACLLCIEAAMAPGEVINVGSGRQWSNEEVVDLIQSICGRQASIRAGAFPARSYDRASWVADIHKAQRVLGWNPEHALREGLIRTVGFFRARWGMH